MPKQEILSTFSLSEFGVCDERGLSREMRPKQRSEVEAEKRGRSREAEPKQRSRVEAEK